MTVMCSGVGSLDTDPDDGPRDKPLRIGVASCDQVLWNNSTAAERVRGKDWREIARKSADLRREHPDVEIVVDIEVVIAAEARTALAMLDSDARETASGTLIYVGTPSGLAGLIADIHALGIVDGAVLIPRSAGMTRLIRDAVLPVLHSKLRMPAA